MVLMQANNTVLQLEKQMSRWDTPTLRVEDNNLFIKVPIAKNTDPSNQLYDILEAITGHLLDDIIIEPGFEDEVSDEVLMNLVQNFFTKDLVNG
jgi:hypothetical protein